MYVQCIHHFLEIELTYFWERPDCGEALYSDEIVVELKDGVFQQQCNSSLSIYL